MYTKLTSNRYIMRVAAVLYLLIHSSIALAEIISLPQRGDLLTATVSVNIDIDPNTHLYTYNYSVSNAANSGQEIAFFALEIGGDFVNIIESTSPTGWDFGVHEDRPIISWSAVDGNPPADWVDDGNIPPSPFQIKPGETLTGFSIKTFSPPAEGLSYTQGFIKLPEATDADDFEDAGIAVLDFTENSFVSNTTVPLIEPLAGGRRPAIDGFLSFVNLTGKKIYFLILPL